MNIHSNIEYFFNIQSSFLDELDIHQDIHSISEYSERIFIIIFWNIHLNCSSTWNILFHLEIFSKIFIRSTLVILDIHMNIHYWFWISLLEKGYSCLFLDIPDAPDPSLPCGRPDCFAMLPISHLSWILVCAFSSG